MHARRTAAIVPLTGDERRLEILKLLAVLWRRKGTIFLSTFVFVGTAVAATALLPQEYTAETQVIVEGDDSSTSLLNDLGLSEMAMSLTTASDDIQNKIYLATSAPVIDEMIWKLQLRNSKGELYKAADVASASILAPVFGTPTLTITQTQGTDVLVIEATGPSPDAARLMADTLARVYIEQQTEQARADYGEAQKFIQERLKVVTGELDVAYKQIAEVQRNTSIIDLDSEQKAAVGRLSELTMERELVFSRIKEAQAKLSSAKSFRALEGPDSISSQTLTSNPVIGKLKAQLSDLSTTRQALMLEHHTEKSPEVLETDAKLAGVKAQLAEALVDQQQLDPAIAEQQADLAGLLERQRALTESIDTTQLSGGNYPDLKRQFSQLHLQTAAAEDVYRSLQDQQYQLGIAEAMTASDLRVVAPALRPTETSSPKGVLNLLAGLFLGLGFGIATALLFEYLDDSIRLAEDVREAWELPLLGIIPKYAVGTRPAVATLPPTDPLVEAHRAIRNGIDFASLDKPIKLLGVTSSLPSEGKSTLAMNLAIAMAQDGRRVLLIDADLRLPTQHKRFPELVSAPGLVEVLARATPPNDAVQTTSIENLDVLAAGALPPNPGQMVESLRMRQVLLELSRPYDIVIVDTPPVLAVNDAIVLARHLDGVVVVVEANRATRRMLGETKARFEAAHVTPLGLVFNKVRASNVPYGQYARYYRNAPKSTTPQTTSPSGRSQGGAA